MCVGHPKCHPCQHTSVTYNHCVAAHFDRDTRLTTPCHNTTYAAPVDTGAKCTNQLCFFEELGGRWVCCRCGGGPNAVGWCVFARPRTEVNALTGLAEQLTACDHCCCWNCSAYPGGGGQASSGRGGSSSKHRKQHHGSSRRGGGGSSSSSSGQGAGGQSGQGAGSSGQDYQWIEMDYGASKGGGGSSSHKKRKNK